MKISKIENESFRGLSLKSQQIFFERINSPKRYAEFLELELAQEKNPLKIIVDSEKNNNLSALITDEKGTVLYSTQEKKYRSFFNLSPIKFLRNLCKKADEIHSVK